MAEAIVQQIIADPQSDILEEEWRPVVGWPNYAISSRGRARRETAAKGARAGRILVATVSGAGYWAVNLYCDNVMKRNYVHVLVATAFHGPRPSPAHDAAHNDGDKENNTAPNLRWATRKENIRDRTVHGTENIGEKNGQSKLTASDVIRIREMLAAGLYQWQIAEQFAVTQTIISDIKTGKSWRSV